MTDHAENTPIEHTVHFITAAEISVRVTATDAETAIDQAHEEAPGSLCAQCTGWGQKWGRSLGEELEMVEVTAGGEVVETGRTLVDELRDTARKALREANRLREQLEAAKARIDELESAGPVTNTLVGDVTTGTSFIQAGHITGTIQF